jgi:hypothetical protein
LNVRPSDFSAQIPCAGNSNCGASGNYIASIDFGIPIFRLFQTMSRNRFDTQIFNQVAQ